MSEVDSSKQSTKHSKIKPPDWIVRLHLHDGSSRIREFTHYQDAVSAAAELFQAGWMTTVEEVADD